MHRFGVDAWGMKRPQIRARNRWYLREWREHRGFSQERLAAKIGKTQGFISQLELNDVNYTAEMLDILAAALDCTVRELLFRDPAIEEDLLDIVDSISEKSKPQAIEILKTFRRTSSEEK